MASNPDFSYLTPGEPAPHNPLQGIVDTIRVKADMSFAPTHSGLAQQYSFSNINNTGVDSRIKAVDYSTPFLDAYQPLNDGSYISKFENYLPGTNNEQRLAEQQTTGEKWSHGAQKFFGKTGTAVLGGTVGVLDGLITGIKEGSLSAAYSSGVNKWLDDLNTQMDYKLPNYYTDQEKNAGFGASLGSANFWANDFLGGLSFTAGAIVSEAMWASVTGGTSLLARGAMGGLARAGAKAFTKAETGAALTSLKSMATKPLMNALISESAEGMAKAGIKSTNMLKAMNTGRFMLTSAGYESAMEARHYMQDTERQWRSNFEKSNGREPDASEYADFKDKLTSSANAVFAANTILVGASNYVTIGKAVLGKSIKPTVTNSYLSRNLFGLGFKEGAEKGSLEAIKATKGQKIAARAWGIGKYALMEGAVEEGGQAMASGTAQNYLLAGYNKDAANTSYGMMEAFYDSLSHTYGTKEGFKEVGLGMLIGIFGGGASSAIAGQGLFNEIGNERADIEKRVDNYNQFHAGNLVDLQKSNARIYAAVEKSEKSNGRGDVVGQIQADREAMISVLERNQSIGGLEYGLEQYSSAINATPVEQISKELGLTSEEAQAWKEERIQEFAGLSKDYDLYSRYADGLLGDVKISKLSGEDRENLGRALTFNMVMGKHALKDSQNITDTLKRFVASELAGIDPAAQAIDTDYVLEQVDNKIARDYNTHKTNGKNLQQRQEALTRKIVEIQNLPNREDNTSRASELNRISQELLDVEKAILENAQQKEVLVEAMNLKNMSGSPITSEMLDNQELNISKLKQKLQAIKETDPQQHAIIEKLIQEQTRAIRNAKGYDATIRKITDPNTRYTLLNGWLSSMVKARGGKETDAEYFAESMQNYIESKTATIQASEQKEDLSVYARFKAGEQVPDEYLQKLNSLKKQGQAFTPEQAEIYRANEERAEEINVDVAEVQTAQEPEKPVTQLDALRQKIKDILAGNKYAMDYIGDEVYSQTPPTPEEVEEYQNLLENITYGQEQNIIDNDNPPTDLGLNKTDIARFKELNKKLNDWKTLDGSIGSDGSSISDILGIIKALDQQVQKNETKVVYEKKDYGIITEAKDVTTETHSSAAQIKSPDNAFAYNNKDGYQFVYLSIEKLASMFPESILFIQTKNGEELYDTTHAKRAKKEGTTFLIKNGEETVTVKVAENSRLNMSFEDHQKIPNRLHVLNAGLTAQSSVYEELPDGTLQLVVGDFQSVDTSGGIKTVAVDKLNSMQKDDVVEMRIDRENTYNAELLKTYEKEYKQDAEQALENLEKNIAIDIFPQGSDEWLGNLAVVPKSKEDDAMAEKNIAIRKEAVARLLSTEERFINTGQTALVNAVLLGSPNIEAQATQNGEAAPKTMAFTEEMLQNIEAAGWMQDTEVQMNKEIANVNYTFMKPLAAKYPEQKIPFVVLNYGNKMVAFPIQMNVETVSKADDLHKILALQLSQDEKAVKVVQLMQQNGIEPAQYPINFSNPEWVYSEELQLLADRLETIDNFLTADELADKNFEQERLMQAARIAVNPANTPFRAGKMLLSLMPVKYQDAQAAVEDKVNEIVALEEALSDDLLYIDALMKQPNSPFQNIENKFTEVFDESDIVMKPTSHLQKIANLGILRQAMAVTIPKKTQEAIGKDKVAEIRQKFARLDKLKETTKDVRLQKNLQNAAKKIKNEKACD